MACPICDRPIVRAATGRPRIYCSDACRFEAFRRRHLRPLGDRQLREWGLEPPPSLLQMLAERS
jgi:hypothetical protein